jgi:hypothetical protein
MKAKVIKVDSDGVTFDNGIVLSSYHQPDCCESHWLAFEDLTLADFEGLEFDFTNDDFFRRIEDYGIELIPIVGHTVKIAGHGSNNGYYNSSLDFCIDGAGINKTFDISECQDIDG